METKKDWTVADKDGNINVPDRLDNLLNRIGFQLRLVTISGLNEIECLARMVKGADEHARKDAIGFGKWLSIHCSDKCDDFNAPDGSLYYFESGEHLKTIEELYEIYIETAVVPK